jgi:hypothetical protein
VSWFLIDHKPKPGGDRYLRLKIATFMAGCVCALVGIALGLEWLVTLAIAILALGLVVRLLPREPPPAP